MKPISGVVSITMALIGQLIFIAVMIGLLFLLLIYPFTSPPIDVVAGGTGLAI